MLLYALQYLEYFTLIRLLPYFSRIGRSIRRARLRRIHMTITGTYRLASGPSSMEGHQTEDCESAETPAIGRRINQIQNHPTQIEMNRIPADNCVPVNSNKVQFMAVGNGESVIVPPASRAASVTSSNTSRHVLRPLIRRIQKQASSLALRLPRYHHMSR